MIIESVYPPIQRLLLDVLRAKIGICAREIELVEVSSGRSSQECKDNDMVNDRFLLKIPISDHYLTWEVVFNSILPNCPPDFDLNDTDFFLSLTKESVQELLPSLNNWDFRNEKALINVISELRSAYLKYQVVRLETNDNHFFYEYSSLINERKFLADRVEVYTDNNTINFFIKLEVNLPLISLSSDDYFIVLYVRFGALSSMRCSNIYASSNVVEGFGTVPELPRNIKCDENLADYVEEVSRQVEEQALNITLNRQKKRKQFIFEMLKHLGHSVISYDSLEYNHVNFLLQRDGFVCILSISLPSLFPSKSPTYRLMSAYSTVTSSQQPLAQTVSPPFNQAWDVCTVVDQALTAIRGRMLSNFRDTTMKVFRLPNV